MTLLVLFHHTALTYGGMGGWFYREIAPSAAPSSLLLTLFAAVNQAYFMGLFFLLAGYFTPAALRNKGARRYLRERLLRLGIPLLAFGLILGPITVALARTSQGNPFLDSLLAIWRSGTFIPGPLWFAEALLIFAIVAMLWLKLVRRNVSPAAAAEARPFPSNFTLAGAALLTGIVAFMLRLWSPVGSNWLGLQFGYFASYTVLFIAGCVAATPRWLERIPQASDRLWFRLALLALPVLPATALLGPAIPALAGSSDGGWTIPALLYAFWEPLVAWGLILHLLSVYQRRFPSLNKIWRQLVERAYTIYVIHPPVLVGIALAWRTVAAPALVKFGVTGIATCLISFVLAGLILRIPGAKRIL
jgi:hypothetical protein